ncbi:MAG: twin-arginine translocase subunit TatC [Bacteroidaceae bacterium]|nr:twin-arginine translocase subunit TatC [Bacteroidaceae bacterium]
MLITRFWGFDCVLISEGDLKYRKYAFILIMVVAAIITPPDIMTLVLVTVPLYLLYEVSIRVVKWAE